MSVNFEFAEPMTDIRGIGLLTMMKEVDQFRPTPIDPAAVLACGGNTSLKTTTVTGPRPTEKADIKTPMPSIDRNGVLVLRPMARTSAAADIQ